MSPYYDEGGITIYHARCEDVLPDIDPATVDLLLTDPPYGINLDTDSRGRSSKAKGPGINHARVAGDNEPFDPAPLLTYGRCILFGANHYASRLPDSAGWLFWDKTTQNDMGHAAFKSEGEFAWTNVINRAICWRHIWHGGFRQSERGFHVHPTQKPTKLMRWLVGRFTKPGDLVLDPYMGSGPVAQACHELGRRYIGVEVVEDYCKVAVSRLRQQTFDFGGIA